MGGDGGMKAPGRDYVKCRGMGFVNPKSTGMGSQANLVRTIREEHLSDYKKRQVRMSFCRITEALLEAPIVCCKLGHLYNKQAVIECLLERKMPKEYSHIRSLKDVKQCNVEFTKDESTSSIAVGETNVANRKGLICPLTKEYLSSGGVKAVVIWKTGVVCAEKALKEMKGEKGKESFCPLTGEKYDPKEDVIPLAVMDDDLEELKKKLPPPKKKQKVSNGADSSTAQKAEPKALPIKSGMPEPPSTNADGRDWMGRADSSKGKVLPDGSKEFDLTVRSWHGAYGADREQPKELTRGYGSTPGHDVAEKIYQEMKNDPNSVYTQIFTPRSGPKEIRDAFGTPTTSGRK